MTLRAITTFGFVGLLRPAPGTWGSLVAVALGWAIEHWLGFIPLVVATVAVTLRRSECKGWEIFFIAGAPDK